MTRAVSATVGAFIVIGIRWTDRFIGLISTIILARLLAPEDFGIIAMASLVIGLIDVLLDMGVNLTLVQKKNATQADYDAAWTLRLLQSCLATAVMFVAAYPAAEYFHDPRVTSVIQALALSVLLVGIENIGIVSFQKKMEFGQEFRFFFVKRVIGFLVTVWAAWYLQNYWALVAGTLSGRVAGVILSYVMHPMRPQFSFVRMQEMLSFSMWNLARGISGYLGENLHRLLVGGRTSPNVMGSYTLASDIAAIPSSELLAPINRVLFPLFVLAKDDARELKRMFLLALGLQALVGVPAGVGLALVAAELVQVMLGEKWIAAVPYVQIMGGINIVAALGNSGGYVLLACGRAKIVALHSWGQVIMFLVVAVLALPQSGAMEIAQIRMGVAALGLLTIGYLILREHPTWRLYELLVCTWRPCVGSLAMVGAILLVPLPLNLSALSLLLIKTAGGAAAYCVSVLLLWGLTGRQNGAETYLMEKFKSAIFR